MASLHALNLSLCALLVTAPGALSFVEPILFQSHAVIASSSSTHNPLQASTKDTTDDPSITLSESLRVQVVDSMPEPLPPNLRNRYYLLRHGQSTANVQSIISSSRSLAYTDKHGLTPTGYQQGRASAGPLKQLLRESSSSFDSSRVVFVSSPFARARETAQACLDGLLMDTTTTTDDDDDDDENQWDISTEILLNDGLVERYFGKLDAEAIYTYAYVWPLDKFNVTHTAFDVESVAAVCHRIRKVILELEDLYNDDNGEPAHIVLVSHADTLQIAKLYAAQAKNVGLFSSYRFQNGEVRPMIVGSTDHFPEPVPLEKPKRDTAEVLKDLKVALE